MRISDWSSDVCSSIYASLLLEGRKGHIAIVPSKLLMSSDQPNPTELAEFYKRNAERFTIPEQRQLRYILIDRARFEKNAAPSDADIQLYYTETKANYAAREERPLDQEIGRASCRERVCKRV